MPSPVQEAARPWVRGLAASMTLTVTGVAGANVSWEWEAVPGSGIVYDLYRGSLATLVGSGTYSHAKIDAATCGIGSNGTTLGDRLDGVNAYYLAGMRIGTSAGPLGNDGAGTPRPAASPTCP